MTALWLLYKIYEYLLYALGHNTFQTKQRRRRSRNISDYVKGKRTSFAKNLLFRFIVWWCIRFSISFRWYAFLNFCTQLFERCTHLLKSERDRCFAIQNLPSFVCNLTWLHVDLDCPLCSSSASFVCKIYRLLFPTLLAFAWISAALCVLGSVISRWLGEPALLPDRTRWSGGNRAYLCASSSSFVCKTYHLFFSNLAFDLICFILLACPSFDRSVDLLIFWRPTNSFVLARGQTIEILFGSSWVPRIFTPCPLICTVSHDVFYCLAD